MKTYDVICPECGHINKNLYLDETNGWMECEKCSELSMYHLSPRGTRMLPVFRMDEVSKIKKYISLLPKLQAGR